MEISKQPKLRLFGVNIVDVKFELFNPNPEKNIDFNFDAKIFYPKTSPNEFRILMNAILNNSMFNLNLTAIGEFEIQSDSLEKDKRQAMVQSTATAILFPYVRSFISTFTSNLGKFPGTIMVPIHFFKGKLEEIVEPPEETEEMENKKLNT